MLNPITLFAISKTLEETCNKTGFLGLIPWYHFLDDKKFALTPKGERTCDIKHFTLLGDKSDLPLVLLAVVDDLLRIAGLVAIAFVIVGAIRYVTSQGNPDDAAKAQSTIINALIGLAVAMISVAIVSFLGNRLGG
jgi:hypothetical protein